MKLSDQHRWRVSRDQDKVEVIKSRYGVISLTKDGGLDVWVKSFRVARKLERVGWLAKNHYDDGALFIRPWADLERAAKAMHAYRKRQLNPDQRTAAIERLAKARAMRKNSAPARFPGANAPGGALIYPQNTEMPPTQELGIDLTGPWQGRGTV